MEWSADNRELLVRVEVNEEHVDIGLVDIETRAYRVLKGFPRLHPGNVVRRSPDGAFVAYDIRSTPAEGHRDIHLLATTDGSDVALVDGPSSDTLVGWSPDGAYLLFKSDRRGTVDLFALPVTRGKPAGEPVLVRDGFNVEPRGMTARGDLLYERVVGSTGDAPRRALMAATVDPTAGTLLNKPWFAAHDREAYSRFPRWSTDGTEFLYLTRRPDGWVVSFRSIESGQTREMPIGLDYIWTFDWSRDARWLVFRATDVAGRNGIFLVDAQTGRTDLMTARTDDIQGLRLPQFTDDGRSITYFRRHLEAAGAGGPMACIRFDIATRTEHVVEASAAGLGPGRFAMGRSPDGRYRLAIHDDLRKKPSVLFAYDTVTGRESEAFRVDQPNAFNYEDGLQWMPDGRAVIVNVRGAALNAFELWWIPVDGRQPRRIDLGVDNLINNALAVHPDGRQVAFLAGDPVASTASSPRREFRLLQRFLPDTTKHDTR
jgi:Tol biopolymer transport system component